MEINTWSSGDNILWIRWISFRASCNTRHEKISQQTMLSPIYLKTLFILALSVLWTFSTTHRFINGNVVPKMYWNLFKVFVNVFALNSFEDCGVQNIRPSFVVVSVELSIPTTSVRHPRRIGLCAIVPPEARSGRRVSGESAWGETPLHYATENGHVAAAELLLSKGAAVDAKDNWGPGASIREACARHRVSNLGHFKIFQNAFSCLKFWETCLHFWVNLKHAKNVGDQWSHVAMAGASKAEAGPDIESSPIWGTSRIFLGWKFCVAALLAENWWSSYWLFDFLDDIAFERLFDLWTKNDNIIDFVSLKVICRKPDVLWSLFDVFVNGLLLCTVWLC